MPDRGETPYAVPPAPIDLRYLVVPANFVTVDPPRQLIRVAVGQLDAEFGCLAGKNAGSGRGPDAA